jgi:hypothetical protein
MTPDLWQQVAHNICAAEAKTAFWARINRQPQEIHLANNEDIVIAQALHQAIEAYHNTIANALKSAT